MIDVADVVTCSTEMMRHFIKVETDRDAEIVADPYEFPLRKPEFKPHEPLRLLWHGNALNLDTLAAIIPDIEGLTLTVITGREVEFNRQGATFCRLWSPKAMLEGFMNCDVVIVPTLNDDPRKLVKSHNRVVEAFRQGRYVCAGSLPSYEQFEPYAYVGNDVRRGIDLALEDHEATNSKISAGQDYVEANFNPDVVGKRWETILISS